MTISKGAVVSICYILKDDSGKVLDSEQETAPLEYIHGSGMVIPGLERQLEGHRAGEKLSVVVEPAEAYGEYNRNWVQEVRRSQFDDGLNIEPGMKLQADTATGPIVVTVTGMTDDTVTVDANHPFAGKRLHFDIEIKDVRPASQDELNQTECGGCGGGCGSCGGGCGSCSGCA